MTTKGVSIAKHEGVRRAALVDDVHSIVDAGLTLTSAVRLVATILQVHRSTVHRWEAQVRGQPHAEWPRVLRPGHLMRANPVHRKIWNSLRRRPRPYECGWLAAVSEASRRTVVSYVRRLHHAGYVARVKVKGIDGRPSVGWRLIRNTGPHAPRLLSGGAVYDQNQELVFVPETGVADV